MSKQVFDDGSVLYTGKDVAIAMEAMLNRRGAYDTTCSFCVHEDDDAHCEGCTVRDTDHCCSCHISAPCSHCVGSKFEASPYLINYKAHKDHRMQWQCFKGTEDVFEKVEAIEAAGFHLAAEVLTTNEAAMYVVQNRTDDKRLDRDVAIEISSRRDFKRVMCKMILALDIAQGLKALEES